VKYGKLTSIIRRCSELTKDQQNAKNKNKKKSSTPQAGKCIKYKKL